MELKRKYREGPSKEDTEEEKDKNVEGTESQPEPEQEEVDSLEIKQNNWF
jgi:hypothetical protein